MKQFKSVLACLLCLVCMTGCSHDNQGFPDEIIFPTNGGRISLVSESNIFEGCFRISGETQSCDTEYDDSESDSILITYDWLSVKARIGGKEIILTASEKKSANDVLDLSINFDPEPEARIKVKRK